MSDYDCFLAYATWQQLSWQGDMGHMSEKNTVTLCLAGQDCPETVLVFYKYLSYSINYLL